MLAYDFSFKGILATSLSVIANVQPDHTRARERVEAVPVPGRPGALHRTEGEDVYDVVPLAPQCTLMDDSKLDSVCAWLCGSGTLIFGSDPLHCYTATVINAIPLARVLEGAGPRSFSPTFECFPFRYLTTPAADVYFTVSGQTITNPGTVHAAPAIMINCSGGDVTLTLGSKSVGISPSFDGPWSLLMDAEAGDCYDAGRTEYRNNWVEGDLLTLPVGTSSLTWEGDIISVQITPRWRWK